MFGSKNFWVLLTGSWVMVLRWGKGTLCLIYALYQVACRISTSFSRDFAVWCVSCAEVLFKMQCGDVSGAKRPRALSRNEIWEIVKDLDSDEYKYYTSQESEDEEVPRPPSQQSSISQPPSPYYSASSSEDGGDECGRSTATTLSVDTVPQTPKACSAHLYWGLQREKQWSCTHNATVHSLSVLLLFFAEIITLLVVETNRYHQVLDNFDNRPPPQHEVTEAEMFAFLVLTLQVGHEV
jgi:hypothetical protein